MLYSRKAQKVLLLLLIIAFPLTILVVKQQQDMRNHAQTAYWRPDLVTSWQMQFSGLPIDQSVDAQVFNIDLFDNDASVVASLHAGGKRVMCYFSAGSWEDWRPDAGSFPDAVKGQNLADWPGERWLDIRNLSVLGPLMEARMDMCRQKGFDGIDPDNIDAYTHNTGFPLTYQDQIQFNTFLANAAHARGMSIGLKNDIDQIADLVSLFDWQLNEQCFEFNECEKLLPFIQSGKPVFNVEYNLVTSQFCPQANSMNFNSIRKNLALDVYREACRVTQPTTPPMGEPTLLYAPTNPSSAQNPAFSPDRNTILFTNFHGGYNQGTAGLFKLALGSTTPVTLLDETNQSSVNLPGSSWNAQTNRITFASDRQDTDEVWTMAADGSGLFRVTRTPLPGYAIEPSFSPDGQWIVFERGTTPPNDTQQGSIYKIRADGSSLTQLTNGPASSRDDRQPNWSPSGDRILFQRRVPGSNNWDIFTMNANGGNIVQATSSTASDTDASFSPDGSWIVYSSDQGNLARPKLFLIAASGGTPLQVTHGDTRGDGAASFSPDGRWIAYESYTQDGSPASLWRVATPITISPTAPTPVPTTSFTCTQFIGYSQTNNWYFGLEQVVPSANYQLLWNGGGSMVLWRDPNYAGWNNAITSPCRQNSATPDRIVLDVTHNQYLTTGNVGADPVGFMENIVRDAIATTRIKYPSARQIVLQTVVGGPNMATCPAPAPAEMGVVRASFNHPIIHQALDRIIGGDVVRGPSPEVRSCADYIANSGDFIGHLTSSASGPIGQSIGRFYEGIVPTSTVGPTVGTTPTITPASGLTQTPTPIQSGPTSTPGIIPTVGLRGPTPTGIAPGTTALLISLNLEGFGATYIPKRKSESIDIALVSDTATVTARAEAIYNELSRHFDTTVILGSNPPSGQYKLFVKATSYLRRNLGLITIQSQNITVIPYLTSQPLLSCDLNNDNVVNILDVNQVYTDIKKGAVDSLADVTRDGIVDIFDHNFCVQNFLKEGERLR